MKRALSVPYMGSKSSSASKIYDLIKALNPDSQVLCDLFCGGFAISSTFLEGGWQVIANDKNKYIVSLIDTVLNKGLDEEKCLEWVSKDLFEEVKNKPSEYPDWYVGYVISCWSFGNNLKSYMYGRKKEDLKEAVHRLVVSRDPEMFLGLHPALSTESAQGIIKQSSWDLRRLALRALANKSCNIFLEGKLEHLERLNRVQHLEGLNKIHLLNLTSENYDQVDIPNGAIIYCDPPYLNTASYGGSLFDHGEFWDWVRAKSKTHQVYVSEYSAPSDFASVLEFDRISKLSATNNNYQVKEKVFTLTANLVAK